MPVPGSSAECSQEPLASSRLVNQAHTSPHETHGSGTPPSESRDKDDAPPTCRICMESTPQSIYQAELNRLLRPCQCKGSLQYVHAGCLQLWRTEMSGNNYRRCPTCKYRYQLRRPKWACWFSSCWLHRASTLVILLYAMFLFGFSADPIINRHTRPTETIVRARNRVQNAAASEMSLRGSWIEHFFGGFVTMYSVPFNSLS